MIQRVVDGVQDGVRPADDNEHLLAQIRSGIIQREALEARLESKKQEILRLSDDIESGQRALKGLQLENGRLKARLSKKKASNPDEFGNEYVPEKLGTGAK